MKTDISLNQDTIINNNTSVHKGVEFKEAVHLSSSHIPKLIIKRGSCSGMKHKACNIFQNVYLPSGSDVMETGEKSDVPNVPGNSAPCCELLCQHNKIQTMQWPLERNGQG